MKSILCKDIAREVLDRCLAGDPPKELPRALAEDRCGDALFGILVEGLADRFEPALCDAYARLFSQALAYATGTADPALLLARYERVRRPRPVSGKYRRIFVLSRVTLGADVAVTSVILSAAKRRFPHAEVIFVGPRKNYDLFAGDPRIHHAPVEYHRGGLRQRLAVWDHLKDLVAQPDSALIDPDSRLTQLGLLPVFLDDRSYHLFESRGYGADTDKTLPELAAAWAGDTFQITGAKPYVALGNASKGGHIAVSLGVGENQAKRLPDPFEEELLRMLGECDAPLFIDKGAGGEEAARVERAIERSGVAATVWDGAFAGFASTIAAAKLYVGYDSAGQHVAAASGVPLISIFAGFPAPRMFQRWRPVGPNSHVIRVDEPDPEQVLKQVREALSKVNLAAHA